MPLGLTLTRPRLGDIMWITIDRIQCILCHHWMFDFIDYYCCSNFMCKNFAQKIYPSTTYSVK